jgi:hypothetical protein
LKPLVISTLETLMIELYGVHIEEAVRSEIFSSTIVVV